MDQTKFRFKNKSNFSVKLLTKYKRNLLLIHASSTHTYTHARKHTHIYIYIYIYIYILSQTMKM